MSINRRMDKEDMVHTYKGIVLSHLKKNETMTFIATWIDIQIIVVSQKEKVKYNMIGGTSGKEPICQCRRHRLGFDPWVRKIPWRRKWQPTPVFFPSESYGQEEPGGLQSIGSHRKGHNWGVLPCITYMWNVKYDTTETIFKTVTDSQT